VRHATDQVIEALDVLAGDAAPESNPVIEIELVHVRHALDVSGLLEQHDDRRVLLLAVVVVDAERAAHTNRAAAGRLDRDVLAVVELVVLLRDVVSRSVRNPLLDVEDRSLDLVLPLEAVALGLRHVVCCW